jgi:hypothetical protein
MKKSLAIAFVALSLMIAGCARQAAPKFPGTRIKMARENMGPASRPAYPDSPKEWWFLKSDSGELAVRYDFVGTGEFGDVWAYQIRVNGKTHDPDAAVFSGGEKVLYENGKDKISLYLEK